MVKFSGFGSDLISFGSELSELTKSGIFKRGFIEQRTHFGTPSGALPDHYIPDLHHFLYNTGMFRIWIILGLKGFGNIRFFRVRAMDLGLELRSIKETFGRASDRETYKRI